jgi:hypothetical protein
MIENLRNKKKKIINEEHLNLIEQISKENEKSER